MSTVEDIVAIEQLLNRYCHHLDAGRVDAVLALFAPEAVLRPIYEGEASYTGHDAIHAWYTRYSQRAAGAVRGLRHTISTPMIDVAGNRATSVCYLDADSVNAKTGARSLSGGRYEDTLVKRDGVWLILERRIVVDYSTALPQG